MARAIGDLFQDDRRLKDMGSAAPGWVPGRYRRERMIAKEGFGDELVGRVCVRLCEFNCRRALQDEAIAIKPLKYDGRIIQPNRYPGITAETMAWQQKCGAKQQKK